MTVGMCDYSCLQLPTAAYVVVLQSMHAITIAARNNNLAIATVYRIANA